jgi:hypothetical protein
VHGDVKLANLLLDAQGDVEVADFGAAGALPLAHGSPAGDRYALGVVAFELLTGRRATGPEPVSAAKTSLPRELDAVFAVALAQDPTGRYRTCAEFAAALRAAFAHTATRGRRSHVLWPLAGLLALAALGAGIWAAWPVESGGSPEATPPAPARPAGHPPRVSMTTTGRTPAGATGRTIQVTVDHCRFGSLGLTLAAQSGPAHVDVSFGRLKSADVLVRGDSTRLWIPVQRDAGDAGTCVFYVSPRGAVGSSRVTFRRGPAPVPAGVPLHRFGAGVTQVATRAPVARSRTPASPAAGIHAGYCLRGQFLQLDYDQARSDPRYKGATFANFIAGQGLTCAQPPPGYVRHGFATSDLGVPPGVYPYYSSP